MGETRFRPISALFMAVAIILTACAQTPLESSPVSTAIPTQVASLPANIAIPTTMPTQVRPFPGLSEWHLLIISDSSNMRVGEHYARLIEKDQKVKVTLLDCWSGNLSIKTALDHLQDKTLSTPATPKLNCFSSYQDLVREAEVMVLFGNPNLSKPANGAWDSPENWEQCVYQGYKYQGIDPSEFATYKENILQSCDPETFTTYKTHLREMLDEIFKIRAGRPIILRMTDFYIPFIDDWKAYNLDAVCSTCIKNFSEAIHQVAAEYGVPVVGTMEGLNGTELTLDPKDKGFIGADGIHLSQQGAQFVAGLLQQSGYAYAGK